MKKITFLISTVFLITSLTFVASAFACGGGETPEHAAPQPGDKSKTYCAKDNENVCAFIWFQSAVNTRRPAEFIVRALPINDVRPPLEKVELWMGVYPSEGHGSDPVELETTSGEYHHVRKANFIMAGDWSVVAEFTVNGKAHTVEIPVHVDE